MKNCHFIIVLDLGWWYFIYDKQNFGFILNVDDGVVFTLAHRGKGKA